MGSLGGAPGGWRTGTRPIATGPRFPARLDTARQTKALAKADMSAAFPKEFPPCSQVQGSRSRLPFIARSHPTAGPSDRANTY
jgi:hypothetical protein